MQPTIELETPPIWDFGTLLHRADVTLKESPVISTGTLADVDPCAITHIPSIVTSGWPLGFAGTPIVPLEEKPLHPDYTLLLNHQAVLRFKPRQNVEQSWPLEKV